MVECVIHPVFAVNHEPAVVYPVLELLQEERAGFVQDDGQARQELHRTLWDEERARAAWWR